MLHGVYTAYQHGLNRILLSSQAAMHVENTNCFSSTDGAVQPVLALQQITRETARWQQTVYHPIIALVHIIQG